MPMPLDWLLPFTPIQVVTQLLARTARAHAAQGGALGAGGGPHALQPAWLARLWVRHAVRTLLAPRAPRQASGVALDATPVWRALRLRFMPVCRHALARLWRAGRERALPGAWLMSVLLGLVWAAGGLPQSAARLRSALLTPLSSPRDTLLAWVQMPPAEPPALGWTADATPVSAPGTVVHAFAQGLAHPRNLYVLPNGDVLVAQTDAPLQAPASGGWRRWMSRQIAAPQAAAARPPLNRILLLRDADGDGRAETRTVFLDGLNRPFGMALIGTHLYVATTDAVLRFPYVSGQTRITQAPIRVVSLPTGAINHHWARSLIASRNASKLYVSVGSNSNAGEHGMASERGRAAIWEVYVKTGAHRVYAFGLRNPGGLAWDRDSGALWAAVSERSAGSEAQGDWVPDYLTTVREGGFYGWPYSYYGQQVDRRVWPQKPDLVARALTPDYALGSHTAWLGLASSAGVKLPPRYQNGMFIAQRGSWSQGQAGGHKVVFVPFLNGRPTGEPPQDLLTGFDDAQGLPRGRPLGLAVDQRGALLVADDAGSVIWRVTADPAEPGEPLRAAQGPLAQLN